MAEIKDKDRKMAEACVRCTLCRHARKTQRGFGFWVVKRVENNMCPFCKAYERVYGRKAHAPDPT